MTPGLFCTEEGEGGLNGKSTFVQTIPEVGVSWDGTHRGIVTWYEVHAPSTLVYEPPL